MGRKFTKVEGKSFVWGSLWEVKQTIKTSHTKKPEQDHTQTMQAKKANKTRKDCCTQTNMHLHTMTPAIEQGIK